MTSARIATVRNLMLRKALVLVAAAAVLGALAGCGNDSPPGTGTSAPPSELSDIQTSLDSIESEMGNDEAP